MLSILLNSYIHTEIIVSLLCAEIIYLIMIFGFKSKFSIDYNTDYRNSMFFLIGIFILFLALVWPVHYISEYYLFSAHMLQHVMISYIAPPLLISGINYKILDSFLRLKYFNNIAKFLFHPVFCFVFFNIIFGLWHLPNIYALSVSFEKFHALEHIMFIFGAIFMWWPLVNQSKLFPSIHYGLKLVYLFLLSIAQIIVFGIITYAPDNIYTHYEHTTYIFNLTPLEDQQLGGIIMKVGTAFILMGMFIYYYFKWYLSEK
jgi:putative membrane protein